MLDILRGRFDQTGKLAAEVRTEARRIGLPDAEATSLTLEGSIALERGMDADRWRDLPELLLTLARQRPGHLFEANAARVLLALGRVDDARAELQRVLPHALASPGPRWLSAMAHLATVATAAGDTAAAALLYDALVPYRGRLVLWGGADSTSGPVSQYLGSLAAVLGRHAEAAGHFEEAIAFTERVGALPFLAHSLAGLGDAAEALGDTARAAGCRDRARDIARQLGMTGLSERLGRPDSEWSLIRDGGDWILTAAHERARLRDGRGLHYLRALLAAPGRDIRALSLAADGAGLGGRPRAVAPEAERARINVTRTIRAIISRIAETAPAAAAHLDASIRTGGFCRYDPAPGGPDRWLV